MPIQQIIWSKNKETALSQTRFPVEQNLEDLLADHIELIDPDWMVISKQINLSNGNRLDMLCMDRTGTLHVLELKRGNTPRDVAAHVIEYASYVSEFTYKDISDYYNAFAIQRSYFKSTLDAAYAEKFGYPLDKTLVGKELRMLIVATNTDSTTEHIVNYLREQYHVKINVLTLQVFAYDDDLLVSRTWYKEDADSQDEAPKQEQRLWNNEYHVSFGEDTHRRWQDAMRFGFVCGGGKPESRQTLRTLSSGNLIWVHIPKKGYVGVGIVSGEMKPAAETVLTVDGQPCRLSDLAPELLGDYSKLDDNGNPEYVVPVRWIKCVPIEEAVWESGFFANQNTVCSPTHASWPFTVSRLRARWGITA